MEQVIDHHHENELGKLKSAGVICISIHPKNGNIMFLLAKERENEGWKQGSCKWTFFGGGANTNESGFECARREYEEESLGLTLPLTPNEYIFELKLYTQCQSLPQFLNNNKKRKKYHHEKQTSPELNDIQNKPNISPISSSSSSSLPISSLISSPPENLLQRLSLSSSSCSPGKEDLSIENLSIDHSPSQQPLSSIASTEQAYFNSAEHFHSPQLKMQMWKHEILYAKWIDWQPLLPVVFLQTRNKLMEYYHLYKSWKKNMITQEECILQLQSLKEKYKNFIHPALILDYTNEMIHHFQVKEEYLEINEIRWWTFDELSQLVKRKGYYKGEKARTSKLPLLYAVLKRVEQMMKK